MEVNKIALTLQDIRRRCRDDNRSEWADSEQAAMVIKLIAEARAEALKEAADRACRFVEQFSADDFWTINDLRAAILADEPEEEPICFSATGTYCPRCEKIHKLEPKE